MPHIHDKIDFTVDVFIVHENKVFLRKHDKYNIWLGVGGHIELNEDPNEAAVREVKEETGLRIELIGSSTSFQEVKNYKQLIAPVFLNRHRISDSHEHISFIYFATTNNNEITEGEGEASKGYRWFTNEELEDPQYNINELIKSYAQAALKTINT